MNEAEALDAMLAHHRALLDGVDERVRELGQARGDPAAADRAGRALAAYLAAEVLPHAEAEEQSIYRAARTHGELAGTLDEMIAEHRTLAAATERLAGAPGSPDARGEAERAADLFRAHVAKENELVLPALAADESVDLVAVLADMHHLTGESRHAHAEGPGA